MPIPGRRAPCKDAFPAVPGSDRFAQDVEVFIHIQSVVRWHRPLRVFREQCLPSPQPRAEVVNAAVGLAGISEGFALGELDLQQPLTPVGLAQSDRATLAVVKDMGCLMDQEIVEAARRAEVFGRQVAGRSFAEAEKVGRVVSQEFPADAGEIEVRQVPGGTEQGVCSSTASMVAGVRKTTERPSTSRTDSCSWTGNNPCTMGATLPRVKATTSRSGGAAGSSACAIRWRTAEISAWRSAASPYWAWAT